MPKAGYRELKRAMVGRALARQALSDVAIELPAEIPAFSRRRATLSAAKSGGSVTVGFHAARSNRIVDMEECRVLAPALFRLVPALRQLMNVFLREGEEASIGLTDCDSGIDLAWNLSRGVDPSSGSNLAHWARRHRLARVSVNGETVVHLETPSVRFAAVDVRLASGVFLQPTLAGERLLQEFVQKAARGGKRIAELYAGCGTFTFALADVAPVHAVDSDRLALSALLEAAHRTQKLKPITTEVRDLGRRPLQSRELARFDTIVLDPPRAGALAQAKELAGCNISRVIYVSCNPESFARDARILVDSGYRLVRVEPIDQFLWSSHIELAAVFSRN